MDPEAREENGIGELGIGDKPVSEKKAIHALENLLSSLPEDHVSFELIVQRYAQSKSGPPAKEILEVYDQEISLNDIIRSYGGGHYVVALKYRDGKKPVFKTAEFRIAGEPLIPDRKQSKVSEGSVPQAPDIRNDIYTQLRLLKELLPTAAETPRTDSSQLYMMMLEMNKANSEQMRQMMLMQQKSQDQMNQQINSLLMGMLTQEKQKNQELLEKYEELASTPAQPGTMMGALGELLGAAARSALTGSLVTETDDDGQAEPMDVPTEPERPDGLDELADDESEEEDGHHEK